MTVTWCDCCIFEYMGREDEEPCFSCSVRGLPYEPIEEDEEGEE